MTRQATSTLAGVAIATVAGGYLLYRAVRRQHHTRTHVLEAMAHQVGGHSCDKTSTFIDRGCQYQHVVGLKVYQGRVLKPFQNKNRGETELAFYERLASSSPRIPYFPSFHGVIELPSSSSDLRRYLQLENLVGGMTHPCIMDIKIGTQSYEPSASPDKIALEAAKCPLQATLGFRLQGIKVFWDATQRYHEYDKHYFRALDTIEAIEESLLRFFEGGERPSIPNQRQQPPRRTGSRSPHVAARADRIHHFLAKLDAIRAWIAVQTEFHFIASSLLFVYDASNAGAVDVRLIDFAHVQFDQSTVDVGVLTGIDAVIAMFRRLLESIELPASLRDAMPVDGGLPN
ncbi:hypothetical protein DYB28_003821 [Aphanomyces astaci]|uniref:Kinase n=1 Tax=Aphanomyces astaci TaxID=112090 RepID=A0A3L6UWW3_APHAT|nr:hypothetical protein DYB26_011585 [Aphanomyces astaci]RLO00899.1 hypothetical protein DYB28_003821 [Aphanomyces astaci]